jgi:hypothetical protein
MVLNIFQSFHLHRHPSRIRCCIDKRCVPRDKYINRIVWKLPKVGILSLLLHDCKMTKEHTVMNDYYSYILLIASLPISGKYSALPSMKYMVR